MPDYKDILRRYTRARGVTVKLHNAMLDIAAKDSLKLAGKLLGLLVDGTLVFRNEEEGNVLMDFAIHEYLVNGKNAVERYVAQHPPAPGSDEEAALAAMQRGHYSVFQVESVVPGFGVHVHDIPLEQRYFLADRGFSTTAIDGVVMATRIFMFEDFVMSSGTALAVTADTMEKIARLGPMKDARLIAEMTPDERSELNATVIRLCLNAEDNPEMRYEDVDAIQPARPKSAFGPRPPGRNEPCPCGSGKKYKKCCGK